jgi:hypothetical protein
MQNVDKISGTVIAAGRLTVIFALQGSCTFTVTECGRCTFIHFSDEISN